MYRISVMTENIANPGAQCLWSVWYTMQTNREDLGRSQSHVDGLCKACPPLVHILDLRDVGV